MNFDDVLRNSRRAKPDPAAVQRWRRAVFAAPETVSLPGWLPSLASGLAMAGMLLLWPAAARGPVALRAEGVACDGRWAKLAPLRADVRSLAQPVPVPVNLAAADRCALCHLDR